MPVSTILAIASLHNVQSASDSRYVVLTCGARQQVIDSKYATSLQVFAACELLLIQSA